MTRNNSNLNRSRISTRKCREIVKYFPLDLEATKITKLSGLNLNTVNQYLKLMRECITKECKLESPFFGARRTRGKRGRRAGGKTIVFGLLKRKGKVYKKNVPNCSRAKL
jgi:transposase